MTVTQRTIYDTDDEFSWTSIQTTYDTDVVGGIRSTRSLFDDTHEEFGTYEDGVLVQTYVVDTGDAFAYSNKVITYDEAGKVAEIGAVFDDYTRLTSTFSDGNLVNTFNRDGFYDSPYLSLGGIHDWQSVSTNYDADGNITDITTVYDDQTYTYDVFDAAGTTNWTKTHTSYDAVGTIEQKEILFDAGVHEIQIFKDGVRSEISQYDNIDPSTGEGPADGGARKWTEIHTAFDTAGIIVNREEIFDTGVRKVQIFKDAVRSEISQYDNFDLSTGEAPADGGAKNWTEIHTTYDAAGATELYVAVLDNGVHKIVTFENGVRSEMVEHDLKDNKTWDTRETLYEAGNITQRNVTSDKGDVTVTLFLDGARTQTLEYDGNDSANWMLQVYDYAEDGSREVTNYTSVEEIPEGILVYFPQIEIPEAPTEYVLNFDNGVSVTDGDQVLDGNFVIDIGQGKYDIQGIVTPSEYGGESADTDLEAFNSWGATFGFSLVDDAGEFDFGSLSLANTSRADPTNIPEGSWANAVTINGYNDGETVQSIEIDLTFEHVTHDLNWEGLDHIEFVASGGDITNDHVENAGWFSMDDLVFIA